MLLDSLHRFSLDLKKINSNVGLYSFLNFRANPILPLPLLLFCEMRIVWWGKYEKKKKFLIIDNSRFPNSTLCGRGGQGQPPYSIKL